jgi:rhodanese-related sulfurtransferase
MRAVRVVTLSMAMVLALGAACSSDEANKTSANGMEEPAPAQTSEAAFVRLDPAAFSERMQSDAVLINVHIPYEGELEQTDAFIPYDKIMADDRLPKDKSQEILLYCRTGRMSEEAGAEMNKAGYTKVAHLEGGMKRWEAEGRQLIHNPAHASETPAKDPMHS